MSNSAKIEISTELLRALHHIHRLRAELLTQLDRGPRQIRAGQGLIAKAAGEVAAAKQRLQKATVAADEKQLQLKSRELRIEELKSKLNTAASNREYAALKEQIAADEQANAVLSDEILEALEALDQLANDVAAAEAEHQKQQTEHQRRVVEIERNLVEVQRDLDRVESQLRDREAEIPAAARDDYRRLIESKGEDALAPVESESCGSCYQVLTTNLIDRLRLSLLVRCPSCNAFLYLADGS